MRNSYHILLLSFVLASSAFSAPRFFYEYKSESHNGVILNRSVIVNSKNSVSVNVSSTGSIGKCSREGGSFYTKVESEIITKISRLVKKLSKYPMKSILKPSPEFIRFGKNQFFLPLDKNYPEAYELRKIVNGIIKKSFKGKNKSTLKAKFTKKNKYISIEIKNHSKGVLKLNNLRALALSKSGEDAEKLKIVQGQSLEVKPMAKKVLKVLNPHHIKKIDKISLNTLKSKGYLSPKVFLCSEGDMFK